MIDPGAIPQFSGDCDVLDGDASALRGVARDVASTGASVDSTWQGMSAFYDAPEAAQLFAATAPIRTRTADLGADVEVVAGALSTYATEVRPIAARLASLQGDAASFVAEARADEDWREDGDKVDAHNGLLRAVDEQVAALMAAERTAANTINALFGGTQWHASDGSADDPAAYGYEGGDVPENAERPWGTPEERDKPWYEDAWDGAWSLGKGIVWDGFINGDVRGLLNLVGFWGQDGSVWSLNTLGETWGGLAKLAASLSPALLAVNHFTALPGLERGELERTLVDFGKGLLAWDRWSEDPARAFGEVAYNVLTIPLAALKIGKVGKVGQAGTVANAADVAGDAGRLARVRSVLGDVGRVVGDQWNRLPSVRELAERLHLVTPDVNMRGLDDVSARADDLRGADEQPPVRGADEQPPDRVPADDPAQREPALVGGREAADEAGAGTGPAGPHGGDGPGDLPPGDLPPGDLPPGDGPRPIDPDARSQAPDGSSWPETQLERINPLPTPAQLDLHRGADGLVDQINGRPVDQYVTELSLERAAAFREAGFSRGQVGPVTSVVFDRLTGRLYEGTNTLVPNRVPSDLHPVLQVRLNELEAQAARSPDGYVYNVDPRTGAPVTGGYPHFSVPGTHAEVQAVNRALYDREAMGYRVTPESLRELVADNRFAYGQNPGRMAPMCPNCAAILGDPQSLVGKRPIDEFRINQP
jgi:hypothetical protein